jgi:hypothetical protein
LTKDSRDAEIAVVLIDPAVYTARKLDRDILAKYDANKSVDLAYKDSVLDLEFKVTQGTNSGIFFHTADLKDPVQTGIEVQVLDSSAKQVPDNHDCGAIYDCLAPSKNMVRPPGEWNHMVITCKGPIISVELNGERICEMNEDQFDKPGQNPDGTKNKYNRRGYDEFAVIHGTHS